MFYSLHSLEFFDQGFESRCVVDVDHEISAKESVVAVDTDTAQRELFILTDDTRKIVHDADVVIAHNTQRYRIHRCSLAAPSCLDDAITKALAQFGCIRTVATVNLDTAVDSDKSKDIITIYRLAALGQLEVDALQVAVDNQHIVVAHRFLRLLIMLQTESFGTLGRLVARWRLLALLEFEITVDYGVHIQHSVGNLLVEIAYLLEFQLFDKSSHDRFFKFDFSVLEFSLNHFLGKKSFLHLRFLQCQFYLGLGSRCLHHVEPILLRLLHG